MDLSDTERGQCRYLPPLLGCPVGMDAVHLTASLSCQTDGIVLARK